MFDTTDLTALGATMHSGNWDHNGWAWMSGFHGLTWLLVIFVAAAILVMAFRLATRDMGRH